MTPGAMGRQVSFFPDLLKVEAWDSREERCDAAGVARAKQNHGEDMLRGEYVLWIIMGDNHK